MSEPFVFDSRYPLFKTPFGAAACGQTISLRCRPLASESFSTARWWHTRNLQIKPRRPN